MKDPKEWTEVAASFAQYVRNLMLGQYWTSPCLYKLFAAAAKAAGFEVNGPVAYTEEDVRSRPGFFPRKGTLSCSFGSDSSETAFRATAWLNLLHKAACDAGSRGNSVDMVVLDFIRRIQPIAPIKLTSIGDLLIVPDPHHLQYSGDGYALVLGDIDPPFSVGFHRGCGSMVFLREGPTDFNRLVCERSCFAIVVGKRAKTNEALRQDIAMRYLGLPTTTDSESIPYGVTARPSIES